MIIICGKTIAEVERDLEMAKQAIASGMPYGVGGVTIADAEKGLEMMQSMMGGAVAPIDNPNYDPCDGCPHWKPNNECEVGYDCEDDEDECPCCGATYPERDGECCEDCGYGCEDEDEDPTEGGCKDGLSETDIDRIIETLGVPKALYDLVRQELGLL